MKRKFLMSVAAVAVVAGAATIFPSLSAAQTSQDKTTAWTCNDVGNIMLPLGDHEGHSLWVGDWMCRADSGPLGGGVATGTATWEWDGPKAREVTFRLVVRKPGAIAVLRGTSGNLALTMTDGKVTGFTGSGQYDYALATGSWAPLAGKSETWTNKGTGPAAFSAESTLQ
jgi:hypothetical protein